MANPQYLSWLLWFLVHRQRLAGVTSATIAHLTVEKLAALPTLLPPVSLQHEFAEKLESISNAAQIQAQSSAALNELFVTLQHRAFRGELTA